MMSFWVTLVAFLVLLSAFFAADGPPLSGWTSYAPLSAVRKDAGPGQGVGRRFGPFDRDLLRRAAAGLAQLHCDDARSPDARDVARASPLCYVGVVHHIGHRARRVRRLMTAITLLILDRRRGHEFIIPPVS